MGIYGNSLYLWFNFFLNLKKQSTNQKKNHKKTKKEEMGGARFSYEGIPRVPSQGGWGHNFRASILQGEVLSL